MICKLTVRGLLFLSLACSGLLSADVAIAQSVEIPPEVLGAERERIEIMRQAAPAVVAIFAASGQGGGSGVIISPDGYTVTNFHVVEGQGPFMKCGLNDGNIYDAVLVGIDPTGDVALIQMLGRDDFPTARIGNSDDVRIGDWTFAMGNPFLLAEDLQPTVTYGMVSGTHRYQYPAGTFLEYTDCIQVDTSINPGNSGGPLFNERGELIGINGRISVEKRGRVNVGAGYAISINQVQHFLDHLKSGRIVDHATLGATVTSTSDGAVIVANILERSSAFQKGLRSGDELITFAGRPIRSVNQFKNILGIYPKGWVLPLSYRREGKRGDIQVRLMALHRAAELSPDGPGPAGPEDKEPDEKEPPKPLPIPGLPHPKPSIPEQYAHLFKAKRGFVNYYFNEQKQQQLLMAFDGWGDFAPLKGLWTMNFQRTDGLEMQIKLSDKALAARFG
ncbi:MAG: trypsin-like peptidase domain-containing protein, partial [Planctomycetaceae bacterium]|nr:trypsin-like peptidase domain-containing protein [Planctomycetaceae bacterium]